MYPLLNSVYISFYFLVCVYVMGMCSYAHKHEGAKALRTCTELVSSILVFETRSLPGSSLVQLECWTNELQRSTYLHPSLFPGLDLQKHAATRGSYVGTGDPNTGPHAVQQTPNLPFEC